MTDPTPLVLADVDEDEFAQALAEAMRRGGATEAEIAAERVAVAVDAAVPDPDGYWTLKRERR